MNFLKKLFGKKEEVVEEPTEPTPTTSNGILCDYCKEEIFAHDKRKKYDKYKYHLKCFRKLKKDSEKIAFGK